MNKVHVSNGDVEKTLIGGNSDSLNGTSTSHASEVTLCILGGVGREGHRAGPRAGGNDNDEADEEKMAFSVDTRRGDEENDGTAGTGEKVAGQHDGVGNGQGNVADEGDGVGGQDGAETGGENTSAAEEKCDEIASSS